MTVVDGKGAWVTSLPLGDVNTTEDTLSIAPVDLGSDVTVKVVERGSLPAMNSSFGKLAWIFMRGPDGRAALAMTLPASSFSPCGMCCDRSKLLRVYAVDLDGAPPKELVVGAQQLNRPFSMGECPAPHDPPITYQAYRLNAAALRFDAFSVDPKVINAKVAKMDAAWSTM